MPRYFTDYLTYIRSNHPQVLNGLRAIIEDSNRQGPKAITQLLKGFPPVLEHSPPVNPALVESLVQHLHVFLYQDTYIISSINNLAEGRQGSVMNLEEYLANNLTFLQFIFEVINITCAELIDENGDLDGAITRLFLANINHPQATPEIKQILFIKSYINEIVVPAITHYWISQPEFKQEMLEKIGTKVMAKRILDNMIKKISERSAKDIALKSDNRLKNAIMLIQNNPVIINKIYTTNINYLIEAILTVPAEVKEHSILDSFFSIISSAQESEESFQTSVNKAVLLAAENAYAATLNSVLEYIKPILIKLLDGLLWAKLSDIKLYGLPLAVNFVSKDYNDYLFTNLCEEDNDYPIKFSDETIAPPFSQEVISSLAAYFHHYLIKEIQYLDNFKKYKYFNFFIKKITLFAYSQTLESSGNVKAKILELLKLKNNKFNPKDDLRAQLIYDYLHKMLVTIVVAWLENSEYQQVNVEPKALYRLVNKIEKAMKKGLDLAFINELRCFPTFANKALAPNFVIPLSAPSGKNNIKSVIISIDKKLELIKKAKEVYSSYLKTRQEKLTLLATRQTSINKKMTLYKAAMSTSSQLLNGVKSVVSELETSFNNFNLRATQLDNQPKELDNLWVELIDNYHTKTLEEVKICLANISKKMTAFDQEITATTENSAAVNSSLTSAKDSGRKMVELEKFYHEMLEFVKTTVKKVLPLAKLALATRERYLLRKNFFPRFPNSVGWNYSLASEDSIIRTSFDAIKVEFVKIKEVCDNLKSCGFVELVNCDYDAAVLREQAELQISRLVKTAEVIEKASRPLFTLLEGSRESLEEIYGMIKFILEDKSLWQHCISPFFGGVKYSVEGVDYRFATRGVAMMKATNELDQNADPDLKIMAIVSAFNNTTPGYGFWRFNEITEFYKIMRAINDLAQGGDKKTENLCGIYSIHGLSLIKMQLQDFMKKTCEPKFKTATQYEVMIRGAKPEIVPTILDQVVNGITSVVSRMNIV